MLRAARYAIVAVSLVFSIGAAASAQEIPRGVVIDDVKCVADATQSYALYLPSTYSVDRKWSLLLAFHPAARGRLIVEKYRAAAEQYGYVVAGSNTSRNGPWSVSDAAVQAMGLDLPRRFAIDPQRIYLTGMSGGARVAMRVALGKNNIAGVIASSAGYPDSQPRASVPFAVFSTAGTEDFNYIEMRQLDRKLTTPHRLVVFNGGHTLPPDAVALEAIEWMEMQAMKSGRRAQDDTLIDRLLERRRQVIAASSSPRDTVHLLDALVSDFTGLRDLSAETKRTQDLAKQSDVKKALSKERAANDAEARVLSEIFDLEGALADESRHDAALMTLRDRLSTLSRRATAVGDSPERSQARRTLRAITMGASARVQDPAYRKLLDQFAVQGR